MIVCFVFVTCLFFLDICHDYWLFLPLVEHRTVIAEVTGLNPIEALIFFRLLLSSCLSWKFTAMIIL